MAHIAFAGWCWYWEYSPGYRCVCFPRCNHYCWYRCILYFFPMHLAPQNIQKLCPYLKNGDHIINIIVQFASCACYQVWSHILVIYCCLTTLKLSGLKYFVVIVVVVFCCWFFSPWFCGLTGIVVFCFCLIPILYLNSSILFYFL